MALALSGCTSLFVRTPPPLDTYELTAPSVIGRSGLSRRQILVAEPSALKSFDGQNIVIKPSPASIEFLKGAQWSDRLPRIVQARLVETYQRAGGFIGVGKPGQGLAIDYQVIVEIRGFDIKLGGGDRAEVDLFVNLLNDRTGQVRASRLFKASAPVSGSGNAAYTDALDRAFGEAAREIVKWTEMLI
ncbi:ABC-type transport auxiliary lipoprotein family protein [Mesorhizobium sp. ANAO-SY3R2]